MFSTDNPKLSRENPPNTVAIAALFGSSLFQDQRLYRLSLTPTILKIIGCQRNQHQCKIRNCEYSGRSAAW
ncbi:MAG: hypothetical protein VKJ02_01885 [Snowella sp.]|nr:hypothetical protein [Snowella sp.]